MLYVLTLSTVVDTRGVALTKTLPCSLQDKLLPNNHLGSSLQKPRENKKQLSVHRCYFFIHTHLVPAYLLFRVASSRYIFKRQQLLKFITVKFPDCTIQVSVQLYSQTLRGMMHSVLIMYMFLFQHKKQFFKTMFFPIFIKI